MEKQELFASRAIIRYKSGARINVEDPVVNEIPLTVMLNGEEFVTLVCSPVFEKELVIGFLAGEGIVSEPDDIKDYFHREEQGVVWVETLNPSRKTDTFLCRNFASCCGKGRPSLYFVNDESLVASVEGNAQFTAESVLQLMRSFEDESETFRKTGGVHSAALADRKGILVKFEDIGRHNALDRIMGYIFLNRINSGDKAVLLSGRVSSEMLIKTVRIGTPVVISRSAPTGLAIDFAEQYGVTVAGFARDGSFNIYCNEERIII